MIEAISVSATAGEATTRVESVEAIAGRGLAGDRYGEGVGTFSRPDPEKQLTLIEAEAVEAVNGDGDVSITFEETRRNLLTRGVALNHLVGREFTVGTVRCRGHRLCEPCGYLEKLTREGVKMALLHRGGLRAEILTDGTIRVGDTVTV